MIHSFKLTRLRTLSLALLATVACHENEPLSPEAVTSAGSGPGPELATTATQSGVVFASFDLDNSLLGSVHTGAVRSPGPTNVLSLLSGARANAGHAAASARFSNSAGERYPRVE